MIAFPLRARRSRLFAASLSVLALVAAGGAVAQEAPADQAPAAPEPHVVIAEPDKAPEEPAAPPIPAVWAPVPPLPGVTPPTIWVPYSMACWV